MDQHVKKIVKGANTVGSDVFTYVLADSPSTSVETYRQSEAGSGYYISALTDYYIITTNPDA